MLGLRCRFSTLDLRSRFTTPTKLSYLLTPRFRGATFGVFCCHPQNGYANKLTVCGYPYSSSSSVSKMAPRTPVNDISTVV